MSSRARFELAAPRPTGPLSAERLRAALVRGSALTVLEVSCGPPEEAQHIPGAVHLDTNLIEADESRSPRHRWKLLPDRELLAVLGERGVHAGSTVVTYGRSPLAAARVAWALLYAGVARVEVLDGGLGAWKKLGAPLAERAPAAPTGVRFGRETAGRPELCAGTAEVHHLIQRPGSAVLADVRALDEHLGRTSGYDYIPARGAIPGARFAHGGPHPNRLEAYTREDGSFVSSAQVAALWRGEGFGPEDRLCFYCGTGWRASVAFLYAYWMGCAQPSVYDGGWMEWSALSSRPRARSSSSSASMPYTANRCR